jgi:signal transduction histidine kinase
VKACLLWIGLLCALLCPARARAQDAQKRVLVCNGLRKDAPVPVSIDRALQRIFGDGVPGGIDYYDESIDLARFQDPAYATALREFIGHKYRGLRFDLVVAIGEDCLSFASDHRELLFPGAAIVFTALPGTARVANSTGVFTELDLAGTLALAIRLQPEATQAVIVSGNSENDRIYEVLLRTQLGTLGKQLSITYLSGLPIRELEKRLATLPPQSIVYHLMLTQDGDGRNFTVLESLDRVAAASNAPIYSFMEPWMDHGFVGGKLLSIERPVQTLAGQALRILRGERADDIPTITMNPHVDEVDWRQLRRWNIDESRVPAGTIVQFREPGAWDRYKYYIIGAGSLLAAQTALIGGLVVQRRRRRLAEAAVLKSAAELHTSHAQIHDLAGRLITAQEAERRRIARDLHDDIGAQLAMLSLELKQIVGTAESDGVSALKRAHEAILRADDISTNVHDLSHQLHPPKLELIGLVAALEGLRRELSLQHELAIEFSHQGVPGKVPRDISLCLFRIAQEGLQNAIKHSRARAISVRLGADSDTLRLTVSDEGAGFDVAANGHAGLGLLSMRERLDLVRGTMAIHSSPGIGTRLEVVVPLGVEGSTRHS